MNFLLLSRSKYNSFLSIFSKFGCTKFTSRNRPNTGSFVGTNTAVHFVLITIHFCNSWARVESHHLILLSCPTFVDFIPLSTTYHNTQAVLTIRRVVASAFTATAFFVLHTLLTRVAYTYSRHTSPYSFCPYSFSTSFFSYLHRGLCGDVPATKFTLFVGARFTQGSRFFTLPHGCIIALLGNSLTWLHYLATYCTISRGAALSATFIHMVFSFVLRLILPSLCLAVYIVSNYSVQ